ncbi:hypothetical protein [Haliangium sp.]|uniref:hypothetical protein n=2 Tax=Haliangium sp. TaxID=2663208 RepID=UPI003D15138F
MADEMFQPHDQRFKAMMGSVLSPLGCLRKQMEYAHERRVTAERQGDGEPAPPRLWILSTGRPRKVLSTYEARVMEGWPVGCWQTRAVDRAHVVVLRELPQTPETLSLRLLARGRAL